MSLDEVSWCKHQVSIVITVYINLRHCRDSKRPPMTSRS
jgi:hypothetical protein